MNIQELDTTDHFLIPLKNKSTESPKDVLNAALFYKKQANEMAYRITNGEFKKLGVYDEREKLLNYYFHPQHIGLQNDRWVNN